MKRLLSAIRLKRATMRMKIIGITILMVLVPMFFSAWYFYREFSSALIRNAYDNLDRQIRQTAENIAMSCSILNNSSLHFFTSANMRQWLSGEWVLDGDPLEMLRKKLQVEEDLKYSMLFNNAWDMKLVNTAYLFMDENTYVSVTRAAINPAVLDANNTVAYRRIGQIPARGAVWLPPTQQDPTVYLSRTISRVEEPDAFLRLLIGTPEEVMAAAYQDLLTYPGSLAFLVDEKGIVFSSSDKDMLGKPLDRRIRTVGPSKGVEEIPLDGDLYLVASEPLRDSGLRFLFALPKAQIMKTLSNSMVKYLLMTSMMMAGFLTVSLLAGWMFTGFIKNLLSGIRRVREGDYEAKMPAYAEPDLNLISETFNNMTGEINHLIRQVYEKQLLLKETDIRFLQSQMNPHFLFNVLVTIGTKAKLSKDETIYQMINSLSELLQAGIYGSGSTETTLGKELEYVRFYLYLQKIRFEDKLEYEIRVGEQDLFQCLIPRLCVEPLVENAVVHGLENKADGGHVCIDIIREASTLVVEIRDDGLGFPSDPLSPEQREDEPGRCDQKRHNRISLRNTDRRLKLMYGEEFGITIVSGSGAGACVTVRVPVNRKGETNVPGDDC